MADNITEQGLGRRVKKIAQKAVLIAGIAGTANPLSAAPPAGADPKGQEVFQHGATAFYLEGQQKQKAKRAQSLTLEVSEPEPRIAPKDNKGVKV